MTADEQPVALSITAERRNRFRAWRDRGSLQGEAEHRCSGECGKDGTHHVANFSQSVDLTPPGGVGETACRVCEDPEHVCADSAFEISDPVVPVATARDDKKKTKKRIFKIQRRATGRNKPPSNAEESLDDAQQRAITAANTRLNEVPATLTNQNDTSTQNLEESRLAEQLRKEANLSDRDADFEDNQDYDLDTISALSQSQSSLFRLAPTGEYTTPTSQLTDFTPSYLDIDAAQRISQLERLLEKEKQTNLQLRCQLSDKDRKIDILSRQLLSTSQESQRWSTATVTLDELLSPVEGPDTVFELDVTDTQTF